MLQFTMTVGGAGARPGRYVNRAEGLGFHRPGGKERKASEQIRVEAFWTYWWVRVRDVRWPAESGLGKKTFQPCSVVRMVLEIALRAVAGKDSPVRQTATGYGGATKRVDHRCIAR